MSARSPKQKVLARVVRGPYRPLIPPTQSGPINPNRNTLLDTVAAAYQRLGTQTFPVLTEARSLRPEALRRRWSNDPILQPALSALLAHGSAPQDHTIDGFLRVFPLSIKEFRSTVYFHAKVHVEAKRIAGRFRGLKRDS